VMCVWHSGDIPRSTKVCASGLLQNLHIAFEMALLAPGDGSESWSFMV
jgi:hypothetical protein